MLSILSTHGLHTWKIVSIYALTGGSVNKLVAEHGMSNCCFKTAEFLRALLSENVGLCHCA